MDFDFSPEDEAFRAELRAFLDDELPTWWKTVFVDDARAMPFTRELCQKLAARGWLTLSWPSEHGGADGSVWQQAVVREEMWAAGEPRGPQYMNLNYIGPLIMRFGTPEQQARHLPRMAAGDVIWCQGFSEPEAGSDLASLKTRAVRDGDRYVVNGQKIWNSYADAPADHCLLLARTDPEVKKQMGISMFLVDMRTPGITVRPIPSMAGKSEFSEIFFDDAVIPVTDRLGDENNGWTLVGEGLAFERIGIARYARANRVLEHLVAYARDTVVDGRPLAEDPAVRARLATLAVAHRGGQAPQLRRHLHPGRGRGARHRSVDRPHPQHAGRAARRAGRARAARAPGPPARRRSVRPPRRRDAAPVAGEHPGDRRRRQHRGAEEHHRPARPGPPAERLTWTSPSTTTSGCSPTRPASCSSARTRPSGGPQGRGAARAASPPSCGPRRRELGWPGIALPEDCGGAGYGSLELAVLAEELGRAAVTSPLLSSYAATLPLLWAGPDARRRSGSSRLAGGEAIGALALVEPGGGGERTRPAVVARAARRRLARCPARRSRCRSAASPTCSW